MTQELRPQVIVLDLRMEGDSEPENEVVKTRLNGCESRIVAISLANDGEAEELAKSIGAFILLDKMKLAEDFVPTIKRCASWSPNTA
jgi:hypothetical protein